MSRAILLIVMLIATPAWGACPLISLTLCHVSHKSSATALRIDNLTKNLRIQESTIARLERRLLAAEAALREHKAILVAQQHQLLGRSR